MPWPPTTPPKSYIAFMEDLMVDHYMEYEAAAKKNDESEAFDHHFAYDLIAKAIRAEEQNPEPQEMD